MAIGYWDYNGTGTTTGGISWDTCSTATTGTSIDIYSTGWVTTTTREVVRRVVVRIPKNWNKEKIAAYIKLVNLDTDTGWKVDMVFEGELAIVDPDIEVRDMDEFVILLKHRATQEDRDKIDFFFDGAT